MVLSRLNRLEVTVAAGLIAIGGGFVLSVMPLGFESRETLRNRFNGRLMNRPADVRQQLETALAPLGYRDDEIATIADTLTYAAFSGTDVHASSRRILEGLKKTKRIDRAIASERGSESIQTALSRVRPWSDEGKPIPKLQDLPYNDFDDPIIRMQKLEPFPDRL